MKRVKASSLVFDLGLYPRAQINPHNVAALCDARAAGATFAPVVIDKHTRRIVDGFHRVKCEQRCGGPDAMVSVVEKTYPDEKEVLLDAIRLNAQHGQKLSPFDRARCILLAEELQVDTMALAGALSIPVTKIGELRAAKSAKVGKLDVPIKRTIAHMAGRQLSKPQAEANKKLGGMAQLFYVNQLITLLESGLLNTADNELMEGLAHLYSLLGPVVDGGDGKG